MNATFSCHLSTDLTHHNWKFGWSNGNQTLISGKVKNGRLFTIYNINSRSNLSWVTGSILSIRIADQTSLFGYSSDDQFHCFALNWHNNMTLNSRAGNLYNVGKYSNTKVVSRYDYPCRRDLLPSINFPGRKIRIKFENLDILLICTS